MSTYTEWVEDVERRQQRLARQQFWMRQRREFLRARLKWKALFIVLLFIVLASLLGAAMFENGCNPPSGAAPGPRSAPSAASTSVAVRIGE